MRLTLTLLMAFAIGACRGEEEPTPDEDMNPEVEEITETTAPMLTAGQPMVEFRERELAEGRELEEGETVEVEPGANVITSEGGVATLVWEDFLSQHLLSGTDSLLSLSQPEMRYAIIDQATGTARYELLGAGEAATVTVKAASWSDVQLTEGEAEVIVSIVPGTEPASWVAVLEGEATVLRGDEDSLTLNAGQVAAITAQGDMPTAYEIDGELLGDWFDDVEAGNTVGDMASIAYRCEVTSEAAIYSEPDEESDSAGDPLAEGTLVVVLQRDEPGSWFRVTEERFFEYLKDTVDEEIPADLLDAWVMSENLDCNGPAMGVSMDPPEELGTSPTNTPPPLPTRAPVVIPTTLPTLAVTRTPTPTPTGAASTVEFWAEDDEIDLGECTELRWRFRNIKAWYLDGGAGVGDDGSKEVCPKKTTTYNVRVILPNDEEVKKSAKVTVRQPEEASATPRASNTPRPAATTQPTAITMPTSTVPPTARPTDPPPPTNTSPPAATDTPEPEPTDTEEPNPTDEPTAPAPAP